MTTKHLKHWPPEDNKLLANLYALHPGDSKTIAKLMNRTVGAVKAQLYNKGINRRVKKEKEPQRIGIITHPRPGITVHLRR
jgi:hypothetical protein